MEGANYPSVSLHNVTETVPAEWADGGHRLCRVPTAVGDGLNDMARDRVRHPTGSEVRFVPHADDAEVEVTLSASEPTEIHTFWGEFQPWKPTDVGTEPETLTFSVPERLRELASDDETGRFDPRVCRIRFDRHQAIAVHDVTGDCRPPTSDELPDQRYLAYGTSITEGAAASVPHTDYVTHVARNCGFDALNLGCSGSAYCETAMAEHIAARDDWDVATLTISVNMAASGGFSPGEFHERADTFVDTIAAAHPEKPITCVTLFPYFDDVTESGDAEHATAYRETLRSIVEESPHDNLSLVEGPELLPLSGLAADLLHPGDHGMKRIGDALSQRLEY
ncbi:SGNH/GDSL hydrolase family protein [Halobacterium noricense]|uniref:SGNH/GDSL hydrolase family protein n=1 Tax=Halobacterium noricense TaxID=223182 RepID=UPI001E402A2B|nr:SGNH/GDSL hydrolase family protein [Halobacterium noricense]UHH26763.1 GDSL-type esterase/lipase family protein [Halobacterium noricense]